MEIVDICDRDGNILGSCTKKEAHQRGELHPCVIAELKDSEGNWVFVKQSDDRQDAGQLASAAGGHIQSGEKLNKALKREVGEELGISNFESKMIGTVVFNRKVNGKKENHLFYVYEISSDREPVLNEESVSIEKYSDDELKKLIKANPEHIGDALHFILENFYPYFYR